MNTLLNDDGDDYESNNHADKYDKELEYADLEIEVGNFMTHEDVTQLFQDRRQSQLN
jgi:hypothetical protein